jgi:hypothetical protein
MPSKRHKRNLRTVRVEEGEVLADFLTPLLVLIAHPQGLDFAAIFPPKSINSGPGHSKDNQLWPRGSQHFGGEHSDFRS